MKTRRILAWGVPGVVVAAGVGVFVYIGAMRAQLELGVGYGARVACGCRYFGNRPLSACRKDFEPGMEPISLSEDTSARTVTAYVPLVASRTVRFDDVLGCQPEPFRGIVLQVPR